MAYACTLGISAHIHISCSFHLILLASDVISPNIVAYIQVYTVCVYKTEEDRKDVLCILYDIVCIVYCNIKFG